MEHNNDEKHMLTTAHNAGADAVASKDLALNLPEAVKAALRPYVHPIVSSVFTLAVTGVDAALSKVPFFGSIAAGIVNPIIQNLEPVVESKLTQLLA